MVDAVFSIGTLVTIDVQNPAYANRGAWIVVDNNYKGDRAVVEQTNSEGQCCRIAVLRSNCHSLTLRLPDTGMEIQDFMLSNSSRLNVWIPLPGMPGNSILLKKTTGLPGVEQLSPGSALLRANTVLSWPRLTALGIGVRFRSVEFGCEHDLEFFDVLAWCPAGHVWIFCAWCGKFHFPCEGGHRESGEHQRALRYLQVDGAELCVDRMRGYGWRHPRDRFL